MYKMKENKELQRKMLFCVELQNRNTLMTGVVCLVVGIFNWFLNAKNREYLTHCIHKLSRLQQIVFTFPFLLHILLLLKSQAKLLFDWLEPPTNWFISHFFDKNNKFIPFIFSNHLGIGNETMLQDWKYFQSKKLRKKRSWFQRGCYQL